MPDPDAQLYFTAAIVVGMVVVTLAGGLATLWQSFHCVYCNRWLPWRTVKSLGCACENKGQCRLERLVQDIRRGDI